MPDYINSLDTVTLDLALAGAKTQIAKLERDLEHARLDGKHQFDLRLALQSLVDSLTFDRLKSEELDDAVELLKRIEKENLAYLKESLARIKPQI